VYIHTNTYTYIFIYLHTCIRYHIVEGVIDFWKTILEFRITVWFIIMNCAFCIMDQKEVNLHTYIYIYISIRWQSLSHALYYREVENTASAVNARTHVHTFTHAHTLYLSLTHIYTHAHTHTLTHTHTGKSTPRLAAQCANTCRHIYPLSFTRTYTHTHTPTLIPIFIYREAKTWISAISAGTHAHTLTHTLSCLHARIHAHTLTLAFTPIQGSGDRSQRHECRDTCSHTYTHSLSFTRTYTHTHTHTHNHTHTHAHTGKWRPHSAPLVRETYDTSSLLASLPQAPPGVCVLCIYVYVYIHIYIWHIMYTYTYVYGIVWVHTQVHLVAAYISPSWPFWCVHVIRVCVRIHTHTYIYIWHIIHTRVYFFTYDIYHVYIHKYTSSLLASFRQAPPCVCMLYTCVSIPIYIRV